MKKMICVLALVTLTVVLGGCNETQTDTGAPVAINLVTQNTISDSGLYANYKYGYKLQLPKISDETYEDVFVPTNGSVYSKEESDLANIYLGGGANLQLNIYAKDGQEYADLIKYRTFEKMEINDYEVLRNSDYGTANDWFITTVFLGEKYAYEFVFSNDTKDQKVIDIQDEVLKSFQLLKGY